MACEGLEGTREALSALRGEMVPVEGFRGVWPPLRRSAACGGRGPRRAGRSGPRVRRVAQEALTNVRKHTPGDRVSVRLEYGTDDVGLEVRDFGGRGTPGELAKSGSGCVLLGMRERAELLGGTLESGSDGAGFVVRLRVPA